MCRHFDVAVPAQCREDGAEEVTYKERQNFCDWFVPSEDAFDPAGKDHADKAKQKLGYQPRIDFNEGMQEALVSLTQQCETPREATSPV